MISRGRFVKIALVLAAAVLAAKCGVGTPHFSGKMVAVLDGDTIDVMRDGRAQRIRLHGIDCPEKTQPFGTKAKHFASSLAYGAVVRVEERDTDRYGRTVGVVALPDGRILNQELARAGLAWWYREYAPGDRTLEALEREARENKRGLWSDPHAEPPWEFRRKARTGGGRATLAPGEAAATLQTAAAQPTATQAAGEPATAPAERRPTTTSTPKEQGPALYVTKTGKKYHLAHCARLTKIRTPISLREAKRRGYEPCALCRPPK